MKYKKIGKLIKNFWFSLLPYQLYFLIRMIYLDYKRNDSDIVRIIPITDYEIIGEAILLRDYPVKEFNLIEGNTYDVVAYSDFTKAVSPYSSINIRLLNIISENKVISVSSACFKVKYK